MEMFQFLMKKKEICMIQHCAYLTASCNNGVFSKVTSCCEEFNLFKISDESIANQFELIKIYLFPVIKALLFLKIVLYLENIHILNIKNSKQRVKRFSNFTNAENIIDL
ncbi:hypothetical protein T4A_10195 [Trichinella pseudospiralis]|uniref:Uncharacterized protein n=1 Tax=Trichinella pseudospiralis TaxID=6337 RepID=A0A0V1F184_TRIPS|nr:hypothetical protein T4A_10195 [Trichinella pseudospiralis]